MMRDDKFQSLALHVLSGDATPEERATLESCLVAEPSRRDEFEELRATLAITQATLPLAAALDAEPVELPRHRLGELHSAVRLHFQKKEIADDATEGSAVAWFQTLWGRLLWGSGLAVACVAVFLSAQPAPTGIEMGLYAESTTRSLSGELVPPTAPGLRVTRFENDQSFDQWLAHPFAANEKARIWLDEEHDLIHIRKRLPVLRFTYESTRPLPAGDTERRAALETLLGELH